MTLRPHRGRPVNYIILIVRFESNDRIPLILGLQNFATTRMTKRNIIFESTFIGKTFDE